MTFVQAWEPRQWVLRRVAGSMVLVPNYPARGTATRTYRRGGSGSNLVSQAISGSARNLHDARNGDTDACDELLETVAGNVQRIAMSARWQVDSDGVRARHVAMALLAMELGAASTDAELAALVGVAERNYRGTWKPRMADLFNRTIKPLRAELG